MASPQCFNIWLHCTLRNSIRLCRCRSAAEMTCYSLPSPAPFSPASLLLPMCLLCCLSVWLCLCSYSNCCTCCDLLPAANCVMHTTMELQIIKPWVSAYYWPLQVRRNMALQEDEDERPQYEIKKVDFTIETSTVRIV